MRNKIKFWTVCFGMVFAGASFVTAEPQMADRVSQYGITWIFDQPYPVGQFVTGDPWVVGPVNIVQVTPGPQASTNTNSVDQSSIYGAAALQTDSRMRNGSMIVEGPVYPSQSSPGFGRQGYDSRVINYDEDLGVSFPCVLSTNRSLISTISGEEYVDGKLSTPYILGELGFFLCSTPEPVVLETAAILTCLDSVPPSDAFRPPYAGVEKPIYRTSDIQWDLLPALPPLPSSPDWAVMERFFERPWLDHINSWVIQYTGPGENGPFYGREFARLSSLASLMLLQDLPVEQKNLLMIRYLQLGIDLHGMAQSGRQWAADGGHFQGRKWPIFFASLMLDAEALRTFPSIDLNHPVSGSVHVLGSDAVPVPTTLFQEDMDYYYGEGGDGQTALWQIVFHTSPQPPHQETPFAELTDEQKFNDNYRINNIASAVGTALAAQLMGAREIWNHDAFFDCIDQWMSGNPLGAPSWLPQGATHTYDPFVERMWDDYRDDVPQQPGGKDQLKWVWKYGSTGSWELNPKLNVSTDAIWSVVLEDFEPGTSYLGAGTIQLDPENAGNRVLHLASGEVATFIPLDVEGTLSVDIYDFGEAHNPALGDAGYGPRWGISDGITGASAGLLQKPWLQMSQGYALAQYVDPSAVWWTASYFGGPRQVDALDNPSTSGVFEGAGRWTTWTFTVDADGVVTVAAFGHEISNGTVLAMNSIWVSGGLSGYSVYGVLIDNIKFDTGLTPLSAYLDWITSYGLTDTNAPAALTYDAEPDGMNNLLEYALGGNPIIDDAATIQPVAVILDGDTCQYVYKRYRDAAERQLIYDLKTTGDLVGGSWASSGGVYETGTNTTDAAFDVVTNTISELGDRMFIQLEITENF